MCTVVEERNIEAIPAVMNTTELVRGSLLFSFLQPQYAYMIFICLQSCIQHLEGLFVTNIITSPQLAC